MLPRSRKLLLATLVAASAGVASTQPHPRMLETRVVPPLADPAVSPGVARCTSDGRCTVTDADGTRPGSRLLIAP